MSRIIAIHVISASALAVTNRSVQADEETHAHNGFRAIVLSDIRATLGRVGTYVANTPQADDIAAARRWMFQTATTHRLEALVVDAARRALASDDLNDSDRLLVRQTLATGLARTERLAEGVGVFNDALQTVRLRSPDDTIAFAKTLAVLAQLAGDRDAVQEIYVQLSSAYFLNSYVRRLCENRLNQLELLHRPAPNISAVDLDGADVALNDSRGKVVLVDFWATNCPPCLEEFPRLKRLYDRMREQGFEIIGVSLDEDRSVVDAFQERVKLPWLVMNEAGARAVTEAFHVQSIPSMFLIDRDGKIAAFDVQRSELESAVEQLLSKRSE